VSEARKRPLPPPLLRWLGRRGFAETHAAMQELTLSRTPEQPDELWFLEHDPVFTLGLNGKPEHLLDPGPIPVVKTDRGGQVTFHGPGQLVVYVMVDLARAGLGVRELVSALEQAVIDTVAGWSIQAQNRCDAPGVYVDGAKLASIGLRIRRGCSYHGLALNVAMDLAPFRRINPCGFAGLEVTELHALGGPAGLDEVRGALAPRLLKRLGLPADGTGFIFPPCSISGRDK